MHIATDLDRDGKSIRQSVRIPTEYESFLCFNQNYSSCMLDRVVEETVRLMKYLVAP